MELTGCSPNYQLINTYKVLVNRLKADLPGGGLNKNNKYAHNT